MESIIGLHKCIRPLLVCCGEFLTLRQIRQKQIFIFNFYQSTTQDSEVKKIGNHDPFCGSGMTHTGYEPTYSLFRIRILPLKVVGNEKVGVSGMCQIVPICLRPRRLMNVSNCPNLSQTAAIDVLFSINFAIVFDFTYFRFRPSKAK